MEKRTLVALLLVFILFLIFNQFVWKPQQLHQQQELQNQQPQTPPTVTEPVKPDSVILTVMPDSLMVQGKNPEIIKLSNKLMTVTFNSRGGSIQQVELHNFLMHDSTKVKLIPDNSSLANTKLIHPASETPLQDVIFHYKISHDSLGVIFFLGDEKNPQISKSFALDKQYGITFAINVNNYQVINGIEVDFSCGIADTETVTKSKQQDYRFMYYADNEIFKTTLAKMRKKQPSGNFNSFNWMALRGKYFTLVLKENEPALMRSFRTELNPETGNPAFVIDSKQSNPKQSWSQSFIIYAGPTDYQILQKYGKQMDKIPERGASWLRWLANIFEWILKFLHRYIKNYGVVILIFAVIIKLLLHPLTQHQMVHSMRQQKMQPYIEEIRKKYANDVVKQREELTKLYKENKTSMTAGCLPLLIQIPILIPLYSILRYSLDMRNAAFCLWLKDLSEPDPYMILPIIMGGFMLLQSLMMRPKNVDKAQMTEQQKMQQSQMKIMTWGMPIFMVIIFRSMPAGLVLYWTAFNVLSILHQYFLTKHIKKKENQ